MNRIGLFGGTFNPIHFGHLRTAREVREYFSLDRIIFIPSAIPPHKTLKDVAGAKERSEMTRLAVTGAPDFEVSDVELNRSGPSYSVDTVRHFLSAYPEKTHLYLIIGRDAFYEIHTWKSYLTLFSVVPFIVMTRPGTTGSESKDERKMLEMYLKQVISDGYRFVAELQAYVHHEKQPVYAFNATPLDISSTRIRNLVQAGKSIQFLTHDKVAEYIKRKGLYQ